MEREIIVQGTTPRHEYEMPIDVGLIDEMVVTYAQGEEVVLEKRKADAEMHGNKVVIELTQEETARFEGGKMVVIQMKVKTADGSVVNSENIYAECYGTANKEIL